LFDYYSTHKHTAAAYNSKQLSNQLHNQQQHPSLLEKPGVPEATW
jgi:hypothetical protein